MRIWINGKSVTLVLGMTVRQALIQGNLLQEITKGARVIDAWGNEMGLDGALEEDSRIEVVPAGHEKNKGIKGKVKGERGKQVPHTPVTTLENNSQPWPDKI